MLRKLAPYIFDLKAEYFAPDFDRKSVPEIADLIGYDLTSKKTTTRWSSVLFPRDVNQQNKYAYVFRNMALVNVSGLITLYSTIYLSTLLDS